ncbi:MAG: nucleotidyltransferase family protein [Clostridia bacterium]|nr:nucleotidyltransferase family protein [Clostridia bacterium]
MRVCGVVCEYNPFHKGHALHLARAREKTGADYIVCVMSGAVTQRGHFARHDKWTRTKMALSCGADLVLELPARFACAPAMEFAAGAVKTLCGTGVLSHLSFGCEEEALPFLSAAAKALKEETPAFKAALRQALDEGMPYPRARALAAQQASGIENLAEILCAPNAALALEYIAALPDDILPVPVVREGAGYHDAQLSALSSATAVRAALQAGDLPGALAAVPCPDLLREAELSGRFHQPDALDTALLYRLRTMSPNALAEIAGIDEGLQHRFLAAARGASARDSLIHQVKSKRYTYARLSRICTNALLGVTREFAAQNAQPAYARVLGFRREAAPLLSAIKKNGSLPLVTKVADYAYPLLDLDIRAQDVWALGCASPALQKSGCDYTTSPVIL